MSAYRLLIIATMLVSALLPSTAQAQVIGPGPCHSDTPWGCYADRLYLPAVAAPDHVWASWQGFTICTDLRCLAAPVTADEAPCYMDADGEEVCG